MTHRRSDQALLIATTQIRTRAALQALTLPHGFTLSVAGTGTVMLGEHGYPGIVTVWLFVTGGSASFILLAVGCRDVRSPPVAAPEVFYNVVPIVVVGLAGAWAEWGWAGGPGFVVAGVLAVGGYIVLVGATSRFLGGRRKAS